VADARNVIVGMSEIPTGTIFGAPGTGNGTGLGPGDSAEGRRAKGNEELSPGMDTRSGVAPKGPRSSSEKSDLEDELEERIAAILVRGGGGSSQGSGGASTPDPNSSGAQPR
jgi:hypothetical protein